MAEIWPCPNMVNVLPEDVLRNVFWRLCVRDKVRARSVCKLWNSVLRSLHQCGEPTWVCIHRGDYKLTMWCPASGEAFDSSLHLLVSLPSMPHPSILMLLASSAGLVLGVCPCTHDNPLLMVVGNPLSGKWNKLPFFHDIYSRYRNYLQMTDRFFPGLRKLQLEGQVLTPSAASMVVDPQSGHYKIAMLLPLFLDVFRLGDQLSLFYDSMMNEWHTPGIKWPYETTSHIFESSLLFVRFKSIGVLDVNSGGCYGLTFEPDASRRCHHDYDDHGHQFDNSQQQFNLYKIGSYKGRCILIETLCEHWGYQVSELEQETVGGKWTWKVLSSYDSSAGDGMCMKAIKWCLKAVKSWHSAETKRWFVFEGDYVVAFSEGAAVAFHLENLSWHCIQVPIGVAQGYKGCCAFTPSLGCEPFMRSSIDISAV